MSAGSQPTGTVHPRSLALLAREGIDTDGLHSKSWDNLPLAPDVVITVCCHRWETCPAYLGPVLRAHWGVDDPAHATGTEAEIEAAVHGGLPYLAASHRSFPRAAVGGACARPDTLEGGAGSDWGAFGVVFLTDI